MASRLGIDPGTEGDQSPGQPHTCHADVIRDLGHPEDETR